MHFWHLALECLRSEQQVSKLPAYDTPGPDLDPDMAFHTAYCQVTRVMTSSQELQGLKQLLMQLSVLLLCRAAGGFVVRGGLSERP